MEKKHKKELPGWVDGGVIAVIIYILMLVSDMVPLLKFLYSVQLFFGDLLSFVKTSLFENPVVVPIFSFIIAPLIWFIGGSIISRIIRKHRAR